MKVGSQSSIPPSHLRHGITLSVMLMLMVISSPVAMLVNPALLAASSPGADDVTTYAPSTISQGGSDFTAQAPLLGPATFRSTDLVSSTAIYEIQFITTTTGVIDKINIAFPPGTGVALAGIIERVGIGPGALTKSGSTVTFDLHSPVSIPAGTFIRLEMVDISNPPGPANYKISVTTRNPSNVPIDGPSLSPAYTIRQVSTGMIVDGAIQPQVTPRTGDTVSVPPEELNGGTAPCLTGEVAVSGGVFINPDGIGHLTIRSESSVGSGWDTVMFNSDPTNAHTYVPIATCMPAMP